MEAKGPQSLYGDATTDLKPEWGRDDFRRDWNPAWALQSSDALFLCARRLAEQASLGALMPLCSFLGLGIFLCLVLSPDVLKAGT